MPIPAVRSSHTVWQGRTSTDVLKKYKIYQPLCCLHPLSIVMMISFVSIFDITRNKEKFPGHFHYHYCYYYCYYCYFYYYYYYYYYYYHYYISNLKRWKISSSELCSLCTKKQTRLHVFNHCLQALN